MNKKDLINAIKEELGPLASQKSASDALDATLNALKKALANPGDKVQLVRFGTFETKVRPARMGLNPLTKEPIQIPASTYVSFKASSTLKGNLDD